MYLELGGLDLLDDMCEGGLDEGPGYLHSLHIIHHTDKERERDKNLFLGGTVSDGLLRALVQGDDALEHADGLADGACVVVRRKGVLRKEVLDDDVRHVDDDLGGGTGNREREKGTEERGDKE